jgi:ketosteroid isomerase-like protein
VRAQLRRLAGDDNGPAPRLACDPAAAVPRDGILARSLVRLLLSAAALVAVVDSPASADSTKVAQNEIRSALEKWTSAFNDRDEHRVCDLFAPDLIANYQGQPELDYASLCQLLQTALQDRGRTYRYSFEINEILVYGDLAHVRLVWTLEIDKDGAAKETVQEPAADIFRRQADGSWKISRYLAYPSSR